MKFSNPGLRWFLSLFFLTIVAFAETPAAKAQSFAFGKNRVQYNSFNWRYLRTKHFNIYYYKDKNYNLATFAAVAEEPSLKQLENYFGHKINKRIDIILYDSHNDFAETNVARLPIGAESIGGVTDPFKNRITIPFSGDYAEFRGVLQHELVHAVINDQFYGSNVQSRLSGNALQIPLWFNEGMAEYASKGWDTQTSLYIRDAVIKDYLPPISRLRGFFGAYRGGESIWNYIVEEYGRNKITEIFQNLQNFRNVNIAFQRSLGLSIPELSKKWASYYKKRYLPAVGNREDAEEVGEFVTKKEERSYSTSPAYNPQGDKIAYITTTTGNFNLVVVNAVTGEKLKTLVKSNQGVNFESLNILNPNLTWSPDGSRIALSALSKGNDQLAIINYKTEEKQYIKFPNVDAIGSVAWSPDGKKIAFDGSIGSFQDIFVYNLDTKKLTNITNDVISDEEPAWSKDSKTIYFTSARGDNLQLHQVLTSADMLLHNYMYNTDIYSVKLGQNRVQRLTKTPLWDEKQPETTRDGRLIFISDENGIPNIYQLNLQDHTTTPLTNLQTGALQISVSGDGSRLALVTLHKQFPNIYTIRAPFSRKKNGPLEDNHWAKRRANEAVGKRVPAIAYVKNAVQGKQFVTGKASSPSPDKIAQNLPQKSKKDTTAAAAGVDTTSSAQKSDSLKTKKQDSSNINFRNYVFETSVTQDTTFTKKYLDKNVFAVKDNTTDDGRYIPKNYRLKFTTDILAASGGIGVGTGAGFNSFGGANSIVQVRFSDLLGDHQISFGSNLQFDLRNSSYFAQYANLKHRINWLYSINHVGYSFQTFGGQAQRFRFFIGGVSAQYPLNRFQRVDFTLDGVNIAEDFSVLGTNFTDNQNSSFLYPQITFTNDKTGPGFITPFSGFRYAVQLSASPPITSKTLQFASLQGDFRKYFHLGGRYSFAVRGSAASSVGRDSQTFFLGGVRGWINRQFSDATIPRQEIGRSFIAQPAIPLRGYGFFTISGDQYALLNAEFRFPLFAALLPGPIPILPLYNLTGVAFIDSGTAFGTNIDYIPRGSQNNPNPAPYFTNSSDLNFKIRKVDRFQPNGADLPEPKGDVLIGAGFGLRAIVFGLPLRYDIGWPYYRDGFGGNPVNYISIGIDF